MRKTNCGSTKCCPLVVLILRKHTGMTFSEIVKFTGYKSSSVGNIVSRRYPEIATARKHKNDFDLDQIVHEYRDLGMTSYELGIKYEVDPATIRKWMRGAGIVRGKNHHICQEAARGKGAAVLKERCRQRVVAKLKEEGDRLELVEYGEKLTLRCKSCGMVFNKSKAGYSHCFTCPSCNDSGEKPSKDTAREYRRRMRIPATPETYDKSVTLGAVYEKYHGICCQCGRKTYRIKRSSPNQATLDHVVALANNGTHTWDNVQLLCSECNSNKRDLGQMRLAV